MHKLCLVIPVYNHPDSIVTTLAKLAPFAIDCQLINDGSDQHCSQILRELAQQYSWVKLIERERNGGKGAAVKTGLLAASAQGYSHALQIDADGQHDIAGMNDFIELSRQHPEAIICGVPVYDETVPKHRKIARYLTHVWVWVNTLSLTIEDSMCGYRVYPLAPCCELIRTEYTGDRMDFDPEILVRSHWRNIAIVNQATRVHYPSDGVSHFQLFNDNYLISAMHARLFFNMLWRSPRLLWRKFKGKAA